MTRTIVLAVAAAAIITLGVLLWSYLGVSEELPLVAVLMLDDFRQPTLDGLRDELERLGYGPATIRMEIRNAKGDMEMLDDLALELCALKPAVLCPLGGVEADATAISEAVGIPVVFMGVSSPIERVLVRSLFEKSRNITGVHSMSTELMPKRLWWIWLLFPDIKTVSVLYEPDNVPSSVSLEKCLMVAPRLGLTIRPIALGSIEEVVAFADALQEGEHEILLATPSAFLFTARERIIIPATRRAKVPLFGVDRKAVDQGAMIAYGASFYDFGRQGARLVERVLSGLPASEIPVEAPDVIELSLNISVARELNFPLPKQLRWLAQYKVE